MSAEEKKETTDSVEFAAIPLYIRVELVNPISYGTRKQSYIDYIVDSRDCVRQQEHSLFIQLETSEVTIPFENIVLWDIRHIPIPMIRENNHELTFYTYDQPINEWVGWYERGDGACVAFADKDERVVYLKNLR